MSHTINVPTIDLKTYQPQAHQNIMQWVVIVRNKKDDSLRIIYQYESTDEDTQHNIKELLNIEQNHVEEILELHLIPKFKHLNMYQLKTIEKNKTFPHLIVYLAGENKGLFNINGSIINPMEGSEFDLTDKKLCFVYYRTIMGQMHLDNTVKTDHKILRLYKIGFQTENIMRVMFYDLLNAEITIKEHR
jgi:hypothetical protein